MADAPRGASLGDAIIAAVDFAEHHPWRFLLTVPVTLGLGLVIAALALKVIVLGPLMNHKSSYDDARLRHRRRREPRPPP